MSTNIKYLFLCLAIFSHSLSSFGQAAKGGNDLFWLRVDGQKQTTGGRGIILEGIALTELPGILKNFDKQQIVGARTNSFGGIMPLPAPDEISKESKGLFNDEVQRRLRFLHLQFDPELSDHTFIYLDNTMPDSTVAKSVLEADALVIDNNPGYWEERINNLPKKLIKKKTLHERLQLLRSFEPDLIPASSFVPFDRSQLANPVYANHHFRSWQARHTLQTIWLSMYDTHIQDTLDMQLPLGVITSSDVVFHQVERLANATRISIEESTNYDQLFIHLDGSEELEQYASKMHEPDTIQKRFMLVLGTSTPAGVNVVSHPIANEFTRQNFTQFFSELAFASPESLCIDPARLDKLDLLIEQAIRDEVFPGAQMLLSKNGRIFYDKNFGHQTYKKERPITDTTLYDLASITKVVATVPALMLLDQQDAVDLDAVVSYYLPETVGSNKASMTLRDILSHQSGMYPYWPFWKRVMDGNHIDPEFLDDAFQPTSKLQDSLVSWTLSTKLVEREDPRASFPYVYSDMGYLLLKHIVERQSDRKFNDFVQKEFYDPMGLKHLGFHPLKRFDREQIAPTEMDALFRKKRIQGSVHDSNAALQGGISGRAGLFSNALDLARFAHMYLEGTYAGRQYFDPMQVEAYTAQQYPLNRRALGWDRRDFSGGGNTSRLASERAFGHTGFTGTSLWVDPQFELIYVFLSNRTYPDAENFKIVEESVRTRLMEIVYEAILDGEATCQCN